MTNEDMKKKLSFDLLDPFIATRASRALEIVDKVNILSVAYRCRVNNGNGKEYKVFLSDEFSECDCPDFQGRGKKEYKPCKHIIAALLKVGGVGSTQARADKPEEDD